MLRVTLSKRQSYGEHILINKVQTFSFFIKKKPFN